MAEGIQQNTQAEVTSPRESYVRFSPIERFEHIIVAVTFIGLALTGIPQRYAGDQWAQGLINLMGGIESIRILHRVLATLLMAEVIYHGGIVTYKLFVLGRKALMMVGPSDLRDIFHWVGYNLGLRHDLPKMPKYNFGEKAEYLAVVWGTAVMVITGFMLWNPIATTNILPGEAVPAALAAHSGEALLAVLSILTWHMYNVVVKRFNRSMWTGRISHEEMEEEHGEELERILRGDIPEDPPDHIVLKRIQLFFPFAFVVSSILIAGLVWFVTLEDTAITTIEPVPISVQIEELSVSADIGVVETGQELWTAQNCSSCHGDNAEGTPGTLNIGVANTSLSFEDFAATVRRGPADMPTHTVRQLSDEGLAHLYVWLQSLGEE